ncbi:MAG: DUF1062 domain-containing protein [Reyranellaceae bacterium]
MSTTLRVQWTITPRAAPQPWLHCSRCRGPRPFRSSGKIRVNANGRRIDAWLIYRCTDCDGSWNRPVVERREVSTIEPGSLTSLQANEPDVARRLAFDLAALRRWTGRVQEFDDVVVSKAVLAQSTVRPQRLEIVCVIPEPIGLRLDRLLATELQVSRSCIQGLEKCQQLFTSPQGPTLRRPPRDGMRVVIDTSSIPDSSVCLAVGAGAFL